MNDLLTIIIFGVLISVVSLSGGVIMLFKKQTQSKLFLPLVAFSAGSLIGGAFFMMIPEGLNHFKDVKMFFLIFASGFSLFFVLEQFLHYHHCKKAESDCRKPMSYLILIGDGLHNLIGGLSISGLFLIDFNLGLIAWLGAVFHEIPQELGDFAALVHAGWDKKKALIYNLLSSSTFLIGGFITYFIADKIEVSFLIPFAAGNFLYIGATDLIPEVNKHTTIKNNIIHGLSFLIGVTLLFALSLYHSHS
ncbi:MAG: ZIP family metal transporter [Ignavibacteria bacterium]